MIGEITLPILDIVNQINSEFCINCTSSIDKESSWFSLSKKSEHIQASKVVNKSMIGCIQIDYLLDKSAFEYMEEIHQTIEVAEQQQQQLMNLYNDIVIC